jgi:HD-GYP domain-containing protein (c-di-GMP phosphodiesterase class II)
MRAASPTIDTAELRVGMFVHIDLGWMSHPFALSSFRITQASQIETIRSLGLARVRWSPEKSVEPRGVDSPAPTSDAGVADAREATPPTPGRRRQLERRDTLAAQRAAVALCQQQYAEAAHGWRRAAEQARHDPRGAGQCLAALSQALVDKMLGAREMSIRVLADSAGDQASHALNVGVISLLMGKACGLAETDLHDLGVGALCHDIGKIELPPRVHRPHDSLSAADLALYRDHVGHGVALGQGMGLTPGALLVIAQHHEHCDGSGYPHGLDAQRMSVAARVVAMVNRYDNLCHPRQVASALTPHQALALLFAQGRKQYDSTLLTSFVHMMGVYPPGSVVQLTDSRFALVESVNSSRPLKPTVLVHDPRVPRDEALLVNLDAEPDLGIRRSLPAAELPLAARDYLRPLRRQAWFFDGVDGANVDDVANSRVDLH